MPRYTFGDEVIQAPTRAEAVREYNRRHAAQNQPILEQAGEQGLDIIGGAQTRTIGQPPKAGPFKPKRKVNVPKPKERGAKGSAPTTGQPGGPKARSTKPSARDTLKQLTDGFTAIANGEDPAQAKGFVLTREGFNGMLGDVDQTVYTDANGVKHTLGGLQTKRTVAPPGTTEQWVMQQGGLPQDVFIPGQSDYLTVNQAISEFMRADPETIKQWQADLSAAGFMGFDSDGNPKQAFIQGAPDDFTISAFADFLEYSLYRGGFRETGLGKYGTEVNEQVGTGKDWRQLLDERVAAVQDELAQGARGVGDGGGSGGGGGGGGGIQMPDPLAVKALANSIGQALMGRTLSEDELNNVVAQVNAGAVASDATNQDYDVESEIAALLRRGPGTGAETLAHDLVNQYSNFTNLIGPMGQTAARGESQKGVTFT